MRFKLIVIIAALFFTLFSGCGYVMRSNPGTADYHYISIEMFENFTQPYQPGLEIRLKKALIDELETSGYILTTNADKADVTITGRILEHKQAVLSTSTDQEPTEIALRMKIRVELRFKSGQSETHIVEPDRETFAGALNESLSGAEKRSLIDAAHKIMLKLSNVEIP